MAIKGGDYQCPRTSWGTSKHDWRLNATSTTCSTCGWGPTQEVLQSRPSLCGSQSFGTRTGCLGTGFWNTGLKARLGVPESSKGVPTGFPVPIERPHSTYTTDLLAGCPKCHEIKTSPFHPPVHSYRIFVLYIRIWHPDAQIQCAEIVHLPTPPYPERRHSRRAANINQVVREAGSHAAMDRKYVRMSPHPRRHPKHGFASHTDYRRL